MYIISTMLNWLYFLGMHWMTSLNLNKLVLMAQSIARRDWRSGGPRFKSHPRLTSQSWPSYQLNQLGSKAASDLTLKQLTTCGVSNTCTLYFECLTTQSSRLQIKQLRSCRIKNIPFQKVGGISKGTGMMGMLSGNFTCREDGVRLWKRLNDGWDCGVVIEFWLISSKLLLKSSRRSMYLGLQEQERSEIDGLGCM